jgi:hypothetical protein
MGTTLLLGAARSNRVRRHLAHRGRNRPGDSFFSQQQAEAGRLGLSGGGGERARESDMTLYERFVASYLRGKRTSERLQMQGAELLFARVPFSRNRRGPLADEICIGVNCAKPGDLHDDGQSPLSSIAPA